MTYTEFRNSLIALAPQSKCLEFIADRIKQYDYRGIHLSQHNRYSLDDAEIILSEFKSCAKGKRIKIRTTDLSKAPSDMPGTEVYSTICSNLKSKCGKHTQDTIRKNFFVDFARMKLIKRFNKNGVELNNSRGMCVYVELNARGEVLANESSTKKEKYVAFTKGLDDLLKGLPLTLFELMGETNGRITRKEYTYFVSFLNYKIYNSQHPNGILVTKQEVIDLVKEYRSLKDIHADIDSTVESYCDPANFTGDKLEKRDYHNWLNETEQVFNLLSQTVYFEHLTKYHTLKLRVDDSMGIDNIEHVKRSAQEKENYYTKHHVSKANDRTLHHIVPLSEWKDPSDFKLLDDWRNMICILASSHEEIHTYPNLPMELSFSNDKNNLILSSDTVVAYTNGSQVFYSKRQTPTMEAYNKELLGALIK